MNVLAGLTQLDHVKMVFWLLADTRQQQPVRLRSFVNWSKKDAIPPLACLKPMNLSCTQTPADFEAYQQTATLDGTWEFYPTTCRSRIKPGVGSERNASRFLRFTTRNPIFCHNKCCILRFKDNSRQNGVVLHNCNTNATLNKNACFTESQKQRQRGREPERE